MRVIYYLSCYYPRYYYYHYHKYCYCLPNKEAGIAASICVVQVARAPLYAARLADRLQTSKQASERASQLANEQANPRQMAQRNARNVTLGRPVVSSVKLGTSFKAKFDTPIESPLRAGQAGGHNWRRRL